MNNSYKSLRERGFTLLESIITLVIVAIMATMMYTYSGSQSFIGSVNPLQWIQRSNDVHRVMEMITADYQGYPRWKPGISYPAGSRVTPISNRTGYYYQLGNLCSSGNVEPSWSTLTSSGDNCAWVRPANNSTYPNPIMPLATLKTRVGNYTYTTGGTNYTIIDNGYLSVANNTPTSWDITGNTASPYLKVTIKASGGSEKLTSIFTKGSQE